MRLPWFMHMHAGRNSLTGVLPTPVGTFVRSCADGRMEVAFYPMDAAFPGGATREAKRIVVTDATDDGERVLEEAVIGFMHAHPTLALQARWDGPGGEPLTWNETGALATHETEDGLFFRINHGGVATLEFLPSGRGMRETVGTFADTCDERTLSKRVDAAVRRRLDRLDQARAGAPRAATATAA